MISFAMRFGIVIVATSLSFATAIPVYPGATLDVAGMKIDRANDPSHTNKLYLTPASFEKVYAFYQSQKGATEETAAARGNSASMKLAVFQFSGGLVALTWPSPVLDNAGRVIHANGTRISIDAS